MCGRGESLSMDYPEEWNDLPRHERRKKIKHLRRKREQKTELVKKIRNWSLAIILFVVAVFGYIRLTEKNPEQIEFEQQLEKISLDGKVEEFPIEGANHVSSGTSVTYQTNPPTSGAHLSQPGNWGVYTREIDDKVAVHNIEHGGIWISYKDISDEDVSILKQIGKQNSQSTVVSPRSGNDSRIVVASWGRMMKMEVVDKVLIQKYIDTYKNQSPEKLVSDSSKGEVPVLDKLSEIINMVTNRRDVNL